MTDFVLGFAFHKSKVALIRKTRPEWQAGKLNGLGGHIENYEPPIEAMAREFHEEAGLFTYQWEQKVKMVSGSHTIYVFTTDLEHGNILYTTEEGRVDMYNWRNIAGLAALGAEAVPNLAWLLPMVRSNEVSAEVKFIVDPLERKNG